MTPTEINRAIAELQGWKWFDHPDTRERTKTFTLPDKWVLTPDGELVFPHSVTNYHASLDACAEFEALIVTPADKCGYLEELKRAMVGPGFHPQPGVFSFTTATAPQRCEAFLRLRSAEGGS